MDFNDKDKVLRECSLLKVKDVELISTYKKGYIGKNVFMVTLNDGSKRYAEQILKNGRNGDAVVIVPITNDGKFVMVIQSRPNTQDEVIVEFPAGMVDEGEEAIESAKRELLEETGYKSDNFYELEWHYQDQGCSRAVVRTYVAEDCYKVGKKELDGFERLEPVEVSYDDVVGLMDADDGELGIRDANSKIAFLQYVKKKRGHL